MFYNWDLGSEGEAETHSFQGLPEGPRSAHDTVCITWQEKKRDVCVCISITYLSESTCVLVLHIFQSLPEFMEALFMIHWPYQRSEMEPHLCN